ncbi:MAG: MaoC family dehydratase [Hyphomicrobiaceae bacterium]
MSEFRLTPEEAPRPGTLPFERLEEFVGRELGVSNWIAIDQAVIDAFAAVSGDHQWIHIDRERASAESPFGTTIAHGFLVLSLVSRMRADAVPPIAGLAMGLNYGFERVRFTHPVRCGDAIRGRFVLSAVSRLGRDQVQFSWDVTVEIENVAKPALVATWLTRALLQTHDRAFSPS